MNKFGLGALLVAFSLGVVACDSKTDTAEADAKADGSGSKAGDKKGDTKPAAAKPKEKAIEMVEHDLSPAHETWKGFVAKGPKGAKVLPDGIKGARIAAKGPNIMERKPGGDNGFDVKWEPGKRDLKGLKKNLEKGAENSKGEYKLTLDFTKDEDGLLEWTSAVKGNKSYSFVNT